MKIVLTSCFIVLLLGAKAQESAGIYKFRWFVDKRITNSVVIENEGAGGNWANQLVIPQNLMDSVERMVKRLVAQEMRMETTYFFPQSNRGKDLKTATTAESVGGLPRGTRRRAMRTEYHQHYVKFKIQVGLNKTFGIGLGGANYSRLKPYVRVKMKSKGIARGSRYRKVTREGGFEGMNSFEYQVGGVTVTNTNALPVEQVFEMVIKGLQKFENKVKL